MSAISGACTQTAARPRGTTAQRDPVGGEDRAHVPEHDDRHLERPRGAGRIAGPDPEVGHPVSLERIDDHLPGELPVGHEVEQVVGREVDGDDRHERRRVPGRRRRGSRARAADRGGHQRRRPRPAGRRSRPSSASAGRCREATSSGGGSTARRSVNRIVSANPSKSTIDSRTTIIAAPPGRSGRSRHVPDVKPRQRMPRSSGRRPPPARAAPDDLAGVVQVGRARPLRDDVPLERRDAGHEPAERREQLRPLEPHVGADERHPDDLDEHVDDDHERQVERVASARPRQLHPAEDRERRDRRPLAERLRVGERRLGAHPVDEVAEEAERVHQVPDAARRPRRPGRARPTGRPRAAPSPGCYANSSRAEEARGDDLDEQHGRRRSVRRARAGPSRAGTGSGPDGSRSARRRARRPAPMRRRRPRPPCTYSHSGTGDW